MSFLSYTNPVFLSLVHFLLFVYIFPIFHSVISLLHKPCLSQLDPFPSIRVHISYLPQCHFFPIQTLSFSAWSISFYSCTYFLSSTVSFLSYTNPLFLSLIHFLLFVYIFPIFHSVISFLPTRTLSFSAWSISFYSCTYFLSSTVSFLSYTNPVFLSLVHFLLFVYIFPIFHGVISFLHKPSLSQLDPFPSIRVHISYLPQCHFFPSYTNPVFLSLIHFLLFVYIFPIFHSVIFSYTNPVFLSLIHFLLFVYIFPIFHSVISFLHEPCLSQLDPFPSIRVHISYLPQCHFFPTRTLYFSAWSISFYSCTYFLSSTVSFLSYTNPVFLSLIHFLLLVYIFPIFHSVISFLPTQTLSSSAWSISFYSCTYFLSSTVSFPSYTSPVFLGLIHFLLFVYIFPIFHSVISFLHEPCHSRLDPFPSISVHISYLPQCHFFPTRTLPSSAWSISFY